MGVLTCESLSRFHGDIRAINDITVDFEPGITGLLGPNGAGKTSLFRMAMGLAMPSAGTIRVLDQDPWDNPGLLRRVGYVPDGDVPFKDRTGRQAAVMMARLAGQSAAKARESAKQAIGKVGLTQAADRKVGTYSRGMGQRLKFAFALLDEPELMLLDEPLIATDPLTRRDLVKLVKELASRGTSVVISTHILPDVEALTQRIALMSQGRLLAYGEVARIRDLLDRYPRTVRVGTSQPRQMGALLWGLDSVLSLESTEGAVVVRTKEPARFFDEASDLLRAKGDVPFTSISTLDENVEAIFRYLVSDR